MLEGKRGGNEVKAGSLSESDEHLQRLHLPRKRRHANRNLTLNLTQVHQRRYELFVRPLPRRLLFGPDAAALLDSEACKVNP